MTNTVIQIINSTKDLIPSISKYKSGLENKFNHLDKINQELLSENINYVTFEDPLYPQILLEDETNPALLFYKGDINLLNYRSLAIVGSRVMDDYAISLLHEVISRTKTPIISGLALGVDITAHNIAVDKGLKCIAVLPSGLLSKVIYPKKNQRYVNSILDGGGILVSQYLPSFEPKPYSFLIRNKIIVNLSNSVWVVKASLNSGSISTGKYAIEKNKKVITSIHRLDSEDYKGCIQLINLGALALTDVDVFGEKENSVAFEGNESLIIKLIGEGVNTLDSLSEHIEYYELIELLELLDDKRAISQVDGLYIILGI